MKPTISTRNPAPDSRESGSYRYFLRAAIWTGILAGAALGTVNLTWIAVWGYTGVMPQWGWWPALVQAHGNAQLYGWTGLFVIGIALHSLPRMLGLAAPPRWLAPAVFGLVFGGLLLALVQPLAARPPFGGLFAAASVLQWAGVTLFAGYVLRAVRRPGQPALGFIAAGAAWFWAGAGMRAVLAAAAVLGGQTVPPAAANAAYLHLMGWGFLASFVLGYSLRLLPAFAGLPPAPARPAWAALALLTLGTAGEVLSRLAGLPAGSLAAAAVTTAGAGAALYALGLHRAPLRGRDPEAAWLLRIARVAGFWIAAAALLLLGLRAAQAVGPVSTLHAHAFGGAARHVLTVGAVSLMIVGVAWRILPLFSGAAAPAPALVRTVFLLLVAGNALRVVGQIGAGLWGGAWYAAMGLSGYLELLGIFLFGMDALRLMAAAPEDAALPAAGEPVAVTLEAPVGPLVAGKPWLVPVFAARGMGQVSSPLFQRTVGQRVTVAQACRRFLVDPDQFLAELLQAERRSASAE